MLGLVGGDRRAKLRLVYQENERRMIEASAKGVKPVLLQVPSELIYSKVVPATGIPTREEVLSKKYGKNFDDYEECTDEDISRHEKRREGRRKVAVDGSAWSREQILARAGHTPDVETPFHQSEVAQHAARHHDLRMSLQTARDKARQTVSKSTSSIATNDDISYNEAFGEDFEESIAVDEDEQNAQAEMDKWFSNIVSEERKKYVER